MRNKPKESHSYLLSIECAHLRKQCGIRHLLLPTLDEARARLIFANELAYVGRDFVFDELARGGEVIGWAFGVERLQQLHDLVRGKVYRLQTAYVSQQNGFCEGISKA